MYEEGEKPTQRVEKRLAKIESILQELKEQNTGILKKINKIENKISEQDKIIYKIEEFCNECENFKELYNAMKAENLIMRRKISEVENELDRQEIKKKRNTAEIFGVPKIQGENTAEVVKRIASEVNVVLQSNEIEECFRANDIQGRERPITVKFKNTETRDKMIKAVKVARLRLGSIQRQPENKIIYVNEALIPKKKQLLYQVKNETKGKQWKIWTYKGEVYIKRSPNENPVKVGNVEELQILL